MSYNIDITNKAKRMRQSGSSLSQISKAFRISKSTASLWTSKEKISKAGVIKIINRQNLARQRAFQKIALNRKIVNETILKKAKNAFRKIKFTTPLNKLIASIFLWTEGEKGGFGRVGFTNSDPLMVSKFLNLLRSSFTLDESKLRALVHIHEYHNEREVVKFWSKITKIPVNQFTKSYLKPHTATRIRENYIGSIHLNYYDFKVARELEAIYNMFAHNNRGVG